MEIHKPKPWHGWREFLKEYGIIVLGVLTALGAEQFAEAVHRDAEVREARAALRTEIRADSTILIRGIEEGKCLLPQLSAYAAWARGGEKPPPFRTLLPSFRTSTWDTVKAGAVPLMPLQERLGVAAFYDVLRTEQAVIDIQHANALVLFGAQERAALNDTDRGRVLDAIAVERQMASIYQSNATGLLGLATGMDLRPSPLTAEQRAALVALCGKAS